MSIKGNIKNFLGCKPTFGDEVIACDFGQKIEGVVTACHAIGYVKIKGTVTLYHDWKDASTHEDEMYVPIAKCRFL